MGGPHGATPTGASRWGTHYKGGSRSCCLCLGLLHWFASICWGPPLGAPYVAYMLPISLLLLLLLRAAANTLGGAEWKPLAAATAIISRKAPCRVLRETVAAGPPQLQAQAKPPVSFLLQRTALFSITSSSNSSSSNSSSSNSSNSTCLAAASRTGIAVPQDVKDFGRLRIYNWLKPTLTTQQLQQLQQQREQQQQQQQLGGLLGPLSYFYEFDVHLQQVGSDAYYEAAAAAAIEAEAAAREAAREASITAAASLVQRQPAFSIQKSGFLPRQQTDEQQQQQQQKGEEEEEDLDEPKGGGLLLEAWLPGVFAEDIKVQLSLIGRHRETEILSGVQTPRGTPPRDPFWDSLDADYELDEDFILTETLAAAERRQAARRKPLQPPPLLPSAIINSPKNTRVLKWEAETFKTRFRDGRALAYQRYQRAFRLTWPADWSRAEARYDSGRLLFVVPPLPSDAPPPDLLQDQKLFPIQIPVQAAVARNLAAAPSSGTLIPLLLLFLLL
ncbi:hypothetical protein ACSSS7_001496 [Eimeria intestinalis]